MFIELQTKRLGNVWLVVDECDLNNETEYATLTQLTADLGQIGWTPDHGLPPYEEYDKSGPTGRLIQTEAFGGPRGSGLFGIWTADEKKKHLAELRRVLKAYGVTGLRPRMLTLQEML